MKINSTIKQMVLPSLEAHCLQEAKRRGVLTRVVALELLFYSRCNDDDYDADVLKSHGCNCHVECWCWWQLLPLIAMRVNSMTSNAKSFIITKGYNVPVCSNEQMIEYYS